VLGDHADQLIGCIHRGTPLILCWSSHWAASARLASGPMVITGPLITSLAFSRYASPQADLKERVPRRGHGILSALQDLHGSVMLPGGNPWC